MMTEHQKQLLGDIRKAVIYYRDHEEKTSGVTLSALLERAGCDNQGKFYSVVQSILARKEEDGLQCLRETRDAMASIGVRPTYMQKIPTPVKKVKAAPAEKKPAEARNVTEEDVGHDIEDIALFRCRQALKPLSHRQRENILNSVSLSYGLGAQ